MKVINASVQEIKQAPGIIGIYHHIEKCGRTCYKSEDKITEDSAMKFFKGLVNRKHYAMLEHGTVYFRFPFQANEEAQDAISKIMNSKYSFTKVGEDGNFYVTTNMRVLMEEVPNWVDSLLYDYALEEPDDNHIRKYTAKFIISRGIANEFVRHRVFSFAQESTRYCNYSKDKFEGELTFIRPEWIDPNELVKYGKFHTVCRNKFNATSVWVAMMNNAEQDYRDLIILGLKPQEARGVLPLDLKTELVVTGTFDQWEDFFDLRMREITGPAHPDAKAIATEWYNTIRLEEV